MTTYHIRPGATYNGDGLSGAAAAGAGLPGAFNTPPTPAANNTYKFWQGGPSLVLANGFRPQSLTSDAATPLTIEAYFYDDGTYEPLMPRPVIDHGGGSNGTGAIFIDRCVNVIVRNMATTNSLAASCSGIRIRKGSNVRVENCDTYGNIYGIAVISTSAVNPGVETTDITLHGNLTHANLGSGIWMQYADASGERIRRITITNNEVYGNGTSSAPNRRGGIMHASERGSGAGNSDSHTSAYGMYDVIVERNRIYNNYSYGLALYAIYNDKTQSRVRHNEVYGNGVGSALDTHSIWVGCGFGTLIEENYVHDNLGFTGGSYGTGVGIFLDFNSNGGAGGSGCIVRRNRVVNQWRGSTLSNIPGSGVHALAQVGAVIESNVIIGCRNGISVTGTGSTDPKVLNNTIIDCISTGTIDGFGVVVDVGPNAEVRNNRISGARVGIYTYSSLTGLVETHNNFHEVTTPRTSGAAWTTAPGVSPDASDTTLDPMQNAAGFLEPGSPMLGAGVHLGLRRDFSGRQRQNPPSIGADDVAMLRYSA